MKTIIIGAGAQARIICEILSYDWNINIIGFVDPVFKEPEEKIFGLPVLGNFSIVPKLIKNGVSGFIVGIGDNKLRAQRFREMENFGLKPVTAIHPTANISTRVKIGKGTVISIGATIAIGAVIGNNVIINSSAIVEHDNIIEDNVHIGPGAVTAGKVTIRDGAFIGMGSAIKELLTINKNSVIGAGSVVLDDIPANAVAVGVPATVIKINKKNE